MSKSKSKNDPNQLWSGSAPSRFPTLLFGATVRFEADVESCWNANMRQKDNRACDETESEHVELSNLLMGENDGRPLCMMIGTTG